MCVVYSMSIGQDQGLEHDRGPVAFPATSQLYNITLYVVPTSAPINRAQTAVRVPRRAAVRGLRIRVPTEIDPSDPVREQPHPGGGWDENALLNRNNLAMAPPAIAPLTIPVNISVPYERDATHYATHHAIRNSGNTCHSSDERAHAAPTASTAPAAAPTFPTNGAIG